MRSLKVCLFRLLCDSRVLRRSALTGLLLIASPQLVLAQSPSITATGVSGTTVVVVGSNLARTTQVRVGDITLTDLVISSDGTTITGMLPGVLNTGTYVTVGTVAALEQPSQC